MRDGLRKIEDFFKSDLEIKKILHEMIPPVDCNFDQDYIMKYSDKLYSNLQIMKYYLVKSINDFNMGNNYVEYINIMFEYYSLKLAECGTDYDKIKKFYNEKIGGMRESFIDKVKKNCCGYLLDKGYNTMFEAKTVNEVLHYLHHSITNNEEYYQSMPKLSQKANDINEPITLYGKENEVANQIYESLPSNLDSGIIDILSLTDKILVMVRDRGHALSFEIDVHGDECDVKYFIPKICNVIMVNNLRGVRPVDDWSKPTVGEFRENKDKIGYAIVDFIDKVPTDAHMMIEGGLEYEFNRGGR